jgi:hypothetical protein
MAFTEMDQGMFLAFVVLVFKPLRIEFCLADTSIADLLQNLLNKTAELEGELEGVTSSPVKSPAVKSESTSPPVV